MSDPRNGAQLSGFYRIEENSWRWTRREFSITIGAPAETNSARLHLQLHIPDVVIQKLGSIQLRAEINGHVLGTETYRNAGDHDFQRVIRGALLKAGPNELHFFLDKYLAPSSTDDRELGVIVKSASLQAR